jgi:hypothetical protein
MHIKAVSTEPTNIHAAALADREVVACRSMLAAAGITLKGPITLSELSEKLSASRLSITQRLQVKTALFRNDLVID